MKRIEAKSRFGQNFETLLFESAEKSLPIDLADVSVTPWGELRKYITFGLLFVCLKLNFWHLDTILPIVGNIFLLLAFCTLRSENSWFRVGWLTTIVQFLLSLLYQSWCVTIYSEWLHKTPYVMGAIEMVSAGLSVATVFLLWRGMLAVQLYKPSAKPLAFLFVYKVLLLLFVGFARGGEEITIYPGGLRGILLVFLVIVMFLFVTYQVWKMMMLLEKIGYRIRPSDVWISNKFLGSVLGVVFVTVLLICMQLFNRYPMKWVEYSGNQETANVSLRQELEEKGMPAELSEMMSDEEISLLKNARKIKVEKSIEEMNESAQLSGVIVDVPEGNKTRWYMIFGFEWKQSPDTRAAEGIRIDMPWDNGFGNDVEDKGNIFSRCRSQKLCGGVFYDKDGKTYRSDYHTLEIVDLKEINESDEDGESMDSLESDFFSDDTVLSALPHRDHLTATFSLPKEGERLRGYVMYYVEADRSYETVEKEEWFWKNLGGWLCSTATLFHQDKIFTWDYHSITEDILRLENGWLQYGEDELGFYRGNLLIER